MSDMGQSMARRVLAMLRERAARRIDVERELVITAYQVNNILSSLYARGYIEKVGEAPNHRGRATGLWRAVAGRPKTRLARVEPHNAGYERACRERLVADGYCRNGRSHPRPAPGKKNCSECLAQAAERKRRTAKPSKTTPTFDDFDRMMSRREGMKRC